MTVALTTRCPHCQRTFPAEEQQLLTKVVCPQCRQAFTVLSIRPSAASCDTDPVALLQDTIASKQPAEATIKPEPPRVPAKGREVERSQARSSASAQATKAATAAAQEPTKETLGRFQLKNLLGAGGFAVVWRAYDPLLERFVALKLPKFGAEEEQQVRRFLNEAKTAARLRHPNIVAVYESGQVGHRLFLASELVVGQPLNKLIAAARPDLSTTVAWVRDLAEALDYAHKEGVVHRDIKPHNILVDEKGRPQITDFGLAREINRDSTLTTEGTVLGTPAYMSPEQARADLAAIGPASDQYSLGVVLYELLTGKRPFDGDPHVVMLKVLKDEPAAPRSLAPQLPRDLEAICLKAMDKDIRRRYGSAADFAADLAHWLGGEPVTARPVRPWERLAKWARRNPAISGLAATVVLVVLAALSAVSLALASSIASRKATESALADVQQQKDIATGLASDLEAKNNELQAAVGIARSEQAKTLLAKQDTDDALKRAQSEEQRATAALDKAVAEEKLKQEVLTKLAASSAELADKIKQLEAAIREKDVTKVAIAAQGRESALKLVQSYWDQAQNNFQDGQYPEGTRLLALALAQLPDTNKPDTAIWNARLRMALALELASQPQIISSTPWAAEIVDLRQIPASLNGVMQAGFADPLLVPSQQQVVDQAGTIGGDAEHSFTFAGTPRGVVPLVTDSLLVDQYLVVHYPNEDKPAQIVEFRRATPQGPATRKVRPYLSEDTRVTAFESGLDRVLAVALLAHTEPSLRIEWATIESARPGRPPVVRLSSKSMTLPERVDQLCRGPLPQNVITATANRVNAWDVGAEKSLGTFAAEANVSSIAFCRPFHLVVVAAGPYLQLLQYPKLTPVGEPIAHSHAIVKVALSPGGQTAHITDEQGRLTSLDLASHQPLYQPSASREELSLLLVRPDGALVSSGGPRLREWQVPQGQEMFLPTLEPRPLLPDEGPGRGTLAAVSDIADYVVAAHGKSGHTWRPIPTSSANPAAAANPKIVAGSELRVYGKVELPLDITALACQPLQPLLAAACTNGIRLYVPQEPPIMLGRNWRQDGNPLRDRDDKNLDVTCLAFSYDGKWLVSGNNLGFVRIWNLEKRALSKEWKTAAGKVAGVTFTRDAGRVAVITDSVVEVYDLQSGDRLPNTLPVPGGTAVAISPDGRTVLAGASDNTTRLWKVDADQLIGEPVHDRAAVSAVAFDGTGTYAYAVGGEGVQAIHVATGLPAGKFLREIRDTKNAAFSASGNLVLLAGRLYTLPQPLIQAADTVLPMVAEAAGAKLDGGGNLFWERGR